MRSRTLRQGREAQIVFRDDAAIRPAVATLISLQTMRIGAGPWPGPPQIPRRRAGDEGRAPP